MNNAKFTYPARMLCVAATGYYGNYSIINCTEEDMQTAYGFTLWQPYARGKDKEFTGTFSFRQDLLAQLEYLASFHPLIWVVCWDAAKILVDFGILSAIESSKLTLAKGQAEMADHTGRERARAFRGMLCDRDPPTILACQFVHLTGTLNFVDVRNYLPLSIHDLARWGASTPNDTDPGLNKPGSMTFTPTFISKQLALFMRHYCRTVHGLGAKSLHKTLPGQAWNIWITGEGKNRLEHHGNADLENLERFSNAGGRREAFYLGSYPHPVFHYDVNAMYPTLAKDLELPYAFHDLGYGVSPQTLHDYTRFYGVLAEVSIDTMYPAYHQKTERIIRYPLGRFATLLCGSELEHALENQRVTRVYRYWLYKRARIVERFSKEMLRQRDVARNMNDNDAGKVIKHVTNTFYGKFTQVQESWEDYPEGLAIKPWGRWFDSIGSGGKMEECRSIGWNVQACRKYFTPGAYFPLVSSFITAAGRIAIYDLASRIGFEQVLYVGVDSLIVTSFGHTRIKELGLSDGMEYGKLRQVAEYTGLEIISNAAYRHANGLLACGIPEEALEIAPGIYTFKRRDRLARMISNGDVTAIGYFDQKIDLATYQLERSSGFVRPIFLQEIGEKEVRLWERKEAKGIM